MRYLTLTIDGVEARVSKWAKRTGVPVRTIYARLKAGMDHKACVEGSEHRSPTRQPTIEITYRGVTKPLSLWAEEVGVSYLTLATRYNRGWSEKDILFGRKTSVPRGRHSTIFLTFAGDTRRLVDWAGHLNVKYTTLYNRIRRGYTDPNKILFGKHYKED